MIKKLIATTLFSGLIAVANAQPIPPNLGGCSSVRWTGTTLEAECPNTTRSFANPTYQFSSLPNANICYPELISYSQYGVLLCEQVYVPSNPAGAYGVCGISPELMTPNQWQQMGCN